MIINEETLSVPLTFTNFDPKLNLLIYDKVITFFDRFIFPNNIVLPDKRHHTLQLQ